MNTGAMVLENRGDGGTGHGNGGYDTDSIKQYLFFHRVLVDGDPERIDHYMALLSHIESGLHSTISDPMDRTLATVLELVVEEKMDPWDIDLVKFARAYRKKLKKTRQIDFITAGRITFLAWTILKKKTETLRDRAETQAMEAVEGAAVECGGWEGDLGAFETPPWELLWEPEEPFNPDAVVLEERVVRKQTRRVDLVDLLEAFEEARREAALQMEIARVRERLKQKQRGGINVKERLHEENIEEDIATVWQTLTSINKDIITLDDIFIQTREDLVTVFVSLLFLVQREKIRVYQRFPRGKMRIKLLVPYPGDALKDSVEESGEESGDGDGKENLAVIHGHDEGEENLLPPMAAT